VLLAFGSARERHFKNHSPTGYCLKALANMGTTCSVSVCQNKPLDEINEIVISKDGLAPGMLFPMWVLPMSEFLKIEGPPKSHTELIREGKLVQWAPGMYCIFISHQWLGKNHPDPEGKQVKAFQLALQSILNGKISVESGIIEQVTTFNKSVMDSDTLTRMASGYVWFDWFSIPQISVRDTGDEPGGQNTKPITSRSVPSEFDDVAPGGTHKEPSTMSNDMKNAVNSIPAYVEYCDEFFVVAPTLEHHDTNLTCDLQSWLHRGWCRVELVCRKLSQRTSVISVQGVAQVEYMAGYSWISAPAFEGDFAVPTDKEAVYPVLQMAFDKKIAYEKKIGKTSSGKKKDKNKITVGPVVLALFLFVVVGSAILQIISSAQRGLA